MSKLYTQTPHLVADEDPASNRQRAVYDRARATAAETAVPVARKSVDQQMPKGNVGSGMGVDDAKHFQAKKDSYYRHNNANDQMRDKTLATAAEAAIERAFGPGAAKEVNAWIDQNKHHFDPVMLAFMRKIGGHEMDAQLARHQEFAAGKVPQPATPSLQGRAKAHALYKGNADTPAAPAPSRNASKATKLYKGAR
jgi:hypothetical protein